MILLFDVNSSLRRSSHSCDMMKPSKCFHMLRSDKLRKASPAWSESWDMGEIWIQTLQLTLPASTVILPVLITQRPLTWSPWATNGINQRFPNREARPPGAMLFPWGTKLFEWGTFWTKYGSKIIYIYIYIYSGRHFQGRQGIQLGLTLSCSKFL
jgi:hypothetical protein